MLGALKVADPINACEKLNKTDYTEEEKIFILSFRGKCDFT